MVEQILYKILKNFFAINLTTTEKGLATDSVKYKYAPAITSAFFNAILILPSVFFLDASILVTVLIPVTMVSGTAWFAVSLANIRKKFEDFGNELTRDLFASFVLSLFLLFLITVSSMLPVVSETLKGMFTDEQLLYVELIAGVLGIYVTGALLYDIFIGALKYDTNDAMLTGQNEAAEKYFKKALSLLHRAADGIAESKSLQVSNYLIGVALYEIFTHIQSIKKTNGALEALKTEANTLIFNPSMSQKDADAIVINLLKQLRERMSKVTQVTSHKSYIAINDEISCLDKNKNEDQQMIDTRLSVIFRELATLLEDFGEFLFENDL